MMMMEADTRTPIVAKTSGNDSTSSGNGRRLDNGNYSEDPQHDRIKCDPEADLVLDDSGECPLVEPLSPPPERSPPPLLPGDDHVIDEYEEVDDSAINQRDVEFFPNQHSSLLALSPSGEATSSSLVNVSGGDGEELVPKLVHVDSADVRQEEGGRHALVSPVSTTDPHCLLVQTGIRRTYTDSDPVTGDFERRKSEDGSSGDGDDTFTKPVPTVGGRTDVASPPGTILEENNGLDTTTTIYPATTEHCLHSGSLALDAAKASNTLVNPTKPLEPKTMSSTSSTFAYYSPSPVTSLHSTTTAVPNLYARVRNASANSSPSSGLALLRHGGYGRQAYNHNSSGGSERDLPQTQCSLTAAYDIVFGGKDKTQRWSVAGTAPEVALLRLKLENVERELKELRGKHEITMNDYQAVLQQLELCRTAKSRHDADMANLTSDLVRIRTEYDSSRQQRAGLEREAAEWRFKYQSKQSELEEFRQQARDLPRQPGELASKLMEEYEELRIEREELRERCRYLDNANAGLQAALHSSQSEVCQMQARYEREVDELRMKNNSLESRQMTSYQQLHRMVQERDLLRSEREMLQQQLDDACADRTRLLNWRQKMEEDYQQLRQQHDSAVTEYHRVMSERDSILKENERHSEEKAHLIKKLKSVESDYHSAVEQLKTVELQLLHLQQQQHQQHQHKFESSKEDLMLFNSSSSVSIHHTPVVGMRRQLPALPCSTNTAFDPAVHYPFPEQGSIASSESEVALITSRAQEEELEKVRRQMDSMKEQMELSRQQMEDAKSRRDWALGERQRIVAERDSMRHMCDTLRRERDDAITRLATAIRDTDELQRQKHLAETECKKLREKMELELKQNVAQGGAASDEGCSSSNSRDSAIDTDMAEWEIQTIELNVDSTQKDAELGMELGGGRDDPIPDGTMVPIYVKTLSKTSKFERVLRPYDCIVQVNNIDVTFMERRSVLDILRNSTAVKMVINRRRLVGMKLISVPLNTPGDGDVGITFDDCVYVSRIKTSSPAAKAGNLAVGDRVVYVNDIPVHGKTASEVQQLLTTYKGCLVVLAVMKSPPVMSPTTSWPGGFISNGNGGRSNSRNTGGNVGGTRQAFSPATPTMNRDESVQTLASSSEHLLADQNLSSSGSCLALPRKQEKQESLLDKVHDKFFRRTEKEKKPIIRASANIADSPIAGHLKRSPPYERIRYKGNPVCSGSAPANGRGSNGGTQEQQALQQLDLILEDAEAPVNKAVANVMNPDNKSSGSTWPKLRGIVPPTAITNGVSTVSQQQTKRGSSNRTAVFNVFQQPNGDVAAEQPNVLMRDNVSKYSLPPVSTPLSPTHYAVRSRPTNSNTYWRKRDVPRPVSYHPAVTVYSNSSNSSVGVGASNQVSSGSAAALAWPNRRSSDDNPHHHKPSQSPLPASYAAGHHQMRPPSAQSNRRHRAVSQYQPQLNDDEDSGGFPRATPATVVTQHHPTHLALIIRQGASSPWRHRSEFDTKQSSTNCTPRSPPAVPRSARHSFELNDGNSSVASLNSPTPSLYHPHSGNRPTSYGTKVHGIPAMRTPSHGDVRNVIIDKQFASEGLGIRIISHGNGVFISAVEKDSLAARHGLQVGDQLLDVCGINMRGANLQAATNVLSQLVRCNRITLTVQYDQNRYLSAAADYHHQQSATSTPRATPNSLTGSYMKPAMSARGCGQTQQSRETLGGEDPYGSSWSEPRFVFIKREASVWPFTLVGGNATGVFVDTVKETGNNPGSLRCGDQILEFDGVDFRKMTMEQALFEMQQRPVSAEISMLVQYNEAKYQRSKRGAGDLFYVRATVDRQAENRDELSFKSGDILRVDNTVFNGITGLWRAWAVDQEGRELFCGIIPSKLRLEDELFRRSGSEISGGDGSSEGGGSRRGTIRRSLKFIRRSSRSTHQRAPSKDSRDLTTGDAEAVMADELYQRVERLDYKQKRPVLIVGALVDILVAKLMEDYPNMFAHCAPECVQPTSISILNQGIQQNIYIDYQKRDKLFEITSVAALKDLMDKGFHCILRVSMNAIERLHRLQIYPVVLYVKFKDYKQIKEFSEGHVNSKEAKEMFHHSAALEADFHQVFTAVIPTQHGNIRHICQRIADAVEHEQKKTLWIISPENI